MSEIGAEADLPFSLQRASPMPWVRARALRISASDLLRALGIERPPVPVVAIAKHMGIRLHRADNPGWDGALQIVRGEAHVWLNDNVSRVRQRFTLAHELGHLVLHDDQTMFRDRITLLASSPKERQANQYAANLLMPVALIRSHVKGKRVADMAKLFEVSEAAMTIRLQTLRLGRMFD